MDAYTGAPSAFQITHGTKRCQVLSTTMIDQGAQTPRGKLLLSYTHHTCPDDVGTVLDKVCDEQHTPDVS